MGNNNLIQRRLTAYRHEVTRPLAYFYISLHTKCSASMCSDDIRTQIRELLSQFGYSERQCVQYFCSSSLLAQCCIWQHSPDPLVPCRLTSLTVLINRVSTIVCAFRVVNMPWVFRLQAVIALIPSSFFMQFVSHLVWSA